jgi:transposase
MPGPIPVLRVPGTAALSEPLWQQIAPLLAPATPPRRRRGRPTGDLRRQLEGMLAVMHAGAPWREVPTACGPWQTVYTRYRSWVTTGLWDRIAAILHPASSPAERLAPP